MRSASEPTPLRSPRRSLLRAALPRLVGALLCPGGSATQTPVNPIAVRRRNSTAASPGSTPASPLKLEGPQGQDRPARLLDALLHQLHPHHARPGQAGGEVHERAGRDRRPLRRSSRTRRTPKHPQGGPALRNQAPRCQRRRQEDLDRVQRRVVADDRHHRPRRQHRRRGRRRTGQLRRARRDDRQGSIEKHRKNKTLNENAAPLRHGQVPRRPDTPLLLPRQGRWPTRRASGCSSPTARTTASSSRTWTGRRSPSPAAGSRATRTGRSTRPSSTTRRAWPCEGDTLYVADRKNNCIRALDLKAQTVKTVAGTGDQDRSTAARRRRGRSA